MKRKADSFHWRFLLLHANLAEEMDHLSPRLCITFITIIHKKKPDRCRNNKWIDTARLTFAFMHEEVHGSVRHSPIELESRASSCMRLGPR